jgi:enterochelin esterase-like enzyme
VEKLIPLIDARYKTIARPAGRGILGGDEGGFSAIFITFQHPGVFGYAAGQSLWPMTDGGSLLLAMIESAKQPDTQFYLDWGKYDARSSEQETNAAEFGERLSRLLRDKGYRVVGGGDHHGSDISSWRLRFGGILKWMFGREKS